MELEGSWTSEIRWITCQRGRLALLLRHCGISDCTNLHVTRDQRPRQVPLHCRINTHTDIECLWHRKLLFTNTLNTSTASPTSLFGPTATDGNTMEIVFFYTGVRVFSTATPVVLVLFN